MRISNTEIAEMVAKRGYNYEAALEGIDAGRTPEEEELEVTDTEVNDIVDAICLSFECENEEE